MTTQYFQTSFVGTHSRFCQCSSVSNIRQVSTKIPRQQKLRSTQAIRTAKNINTLRITSNKTTQLDEYWSLAETVLNLALGSFAVQVVTSVWSVERQRNTEMQEQERQVRRLGIRSCPDCETPTLNHTPNKEHRLQQSVMWSSANKPEGSATGRFGPAWRKKFRMWAWTSTYLPKHTSTVEPASTAGQNVQQVRAARFGYAC